MKGLDLCRRFFDAFGPAMIKTDFSVYKNRIAAGLVGHGSDCFGFDDMISQDHDWGPGFCLWLTEADYREIGPALQAAYDKLPKVFMGYSRKVETAGTKRTGVFCIPEFYRDFTGLSDIPDSNAEWAALSSQYLCACTNGRVFTDPLGEFTRIREGLLSFYPEDIRLFKIAARCFLAAQSGQYNFGRSLKRNAYFTAACSENRFCMEIISLVFLLEKIFAPFYKWRHQAVRSLGELGEFVYREVDELVRTPDYVKKHPIIENIAARMITELKNRGLSGVDSDFLLEHGMAVQKEIKDARFRNKDAWGDR